jgi:hypothetical protein
MSESATYREFMAKWSKVVGKKLVGDEGIKHMSGKKYWNTMSGDDDITEYTM